MGAVTVVTVVFLVVSWGAMSRGYDAHARLLTRTGEVSSTVAMLGATARVGAATGEAAAVRRHFELSQQLDIRVAAILDMFVGQDIAILRDRIATHRSDVTRIETLARSMLARNQSVAASTLLDGVRMRDLRDDYVKAVGTALFALHERSTGHLRMQKRNVLAGGLMLLLAIALTVVQILRRKTVEGHLRCRETQLDTLRAAMGSAMDLQNNLLNNMVYFRVKAEAGGLLDADDIVLIDREIEASRAKMAELCALDEVRTRDIGGIAVLEPATRLSQSGMVPA